MHGPTHATPLSLPLRFTQWRVAQFLASDDEMIAAFGTPHFINCETLEYNWAWQLADGQCVRLCLEVPYDHVVLFCDPPVPDPALADLGLSSHIAGFKILEKPKRLNDFSKDA